MRSLPAALAAFLLASGCSGSAAPPPPGPVPSLAADGAIWSLVEHFRNGGHTPEQENRDVERRVATCMSAAGFRYTPVPGEVVLGFDTIGELRRFRAVHGYGITAPPPENAAGRRAAEANDRYRSGLPAAERDRYDRTLRGTAADPESIGFADLPPPGADGCLPRALRAVREGLPRVDPRIDAALRARDYRTEPEYRAAVTAWAECMRAEGYDLADPGAAPQLAERRRGSERERLAFERDVAVADVTCYVRHVHAVQARLERALLADVVRRFPAYGRHVPPADAG